VIERVNCFFKKDAYRFHVLHVTTTTEKGFNKIVNELYLYDFDVITGDNVYIYACYEGVMIQKSGYNRPGES